ncbi:MAG: exodeoxyribonuclease small subunit [Eubacteriaceae bacterium]|jgi:exodeoxyribonuclease VII small subunit|nr:exodeoxyribonuclease small subunit [Eubacteriaceae bacterium]MDK2937076.1 exodeoxyribonuclease small subunit [Eubacteriaceae bacterium]MDN5307669.1 exodeoxyribonuclease small subunit [Eubacteriaceae bacterium]
MAVKKIKTKMNRLEVIAESLESEELEIESAMKLYEEGMQMIKALNADFDKLEGRLLLMTDQGEADFEENGDDI